jgi:protein CWC15
MGKETKAGSRSFFQQDYSARTKLKFRAPGQTAQVDVQKRDLRAELLRAEREAMDKKRKAAGLPPLAPVASDLLLTSGEAEADAGEDEQARKRRKILEDAAQLDADDDSDDEDEDKSTKKKGKERATGEDEEMSNGDGAQDDDDDEDEDDR